MHLSLKDVNGRDYDSAYSSLCMIISEEARRIYRKYDLSENKNLMEAEKVLLEGMLTGTYDNESQLTHSLRFLSQILHMQCGKKVIILIDEYDVPLDKAYQNGYYEQMLGTLRDLLSQALKSNDSLYFSVLTGCLRISKESIFTGLNNFKVLSISDDELSEYFGFTDYEVKEMLRYYGLEDKYEVIKEWYDGYHFGSTEVYCPWDVINYLNKLRRNLEAEPEPYWINSSSNSILQNILSDATQSTKDELEKLISGEIIKKNIKQEMTYKDLETQETGQRENYLWSVLYVTGYLTDVGITDSGLVRLKIPNREIREIYTEKIRSWYRTTIRHDTARWKAFCEAVKNGDVENFQNIFNQCMRETISIRDTFSRKDMKENFYHGMLLGILQCEGSWGVVSNQESGNGYTDIMLKIPQEKIGCVIEVKYAENGTFDEACRRAMEQIEEEQYADALRKEGMETIHKYGVACYKKNCKVTYAYSGTL